MTFSRALIPAVVALSLLGGAARGDETHRIIANWLRTHSGVQSLAVDFSQRRVMKTLKIPITQQGKLWIDYGRNRYRWQAGNPPQTIVVSRGQSILILRTPLKRYEERRAGSSEMPGLASLARGFPRSLDEFLRKYRVLDLRSDGPRHSIVAQPRSRDQRGVKTFTFHIEKDRYRLLGVDVDLIDGSSLKTSFTRVQTNVAMPDSLFAPSLDGYTETTFSQ